MATRRKPNLTIQANHDALLDRRRDLRKAVKENPEDEAAAALLDAIQRAVLASRKLRQKLGGDAKVPSADVDAREAATVEAAKAAGDAIIAAAKAEG